MSSTPTEIVSSAINCTHVKAPCPDCPYSREVAPGALGGSSPLIYIGQAAGPFVLPCHKHCDFDDPNWKLKAINTPQCAGAAIFRANIGVDKFMPDVIHKLPADRERVFATSAEFLAYHTRMSLGYAVAFLKATPPEALLRRQLLRQSNVQFKVED